MSTNLKDDVRKAVKHSPSANWTPPIGWENRSDASDHTTHDFNKKVCGKRYTIGFKIDKYYPIKWVSGILMNYKNGNLDIETDNGYVVHIPYSGLKWLLPAKQN